MDHSEVSSMDSDDDADDLASSRPCQGPYLHRLLSEGDWNGALSRVRSHPHEAQFTGWGSRRKSALHVAIEEGSTTPPIEIVRSLIGAGGRNSLLEQSASGATAVHAAVARGVRDAAMNEVIRTILHADSSLDGPRGPYSPEMRQRRAVITEIETKDGDTPLGVFAATWTDSVRGTERGNSQLEGALEGGASSPADLTGLLRVLWDRADILLRATAGDSVAPPGDGDRLMLHRILSSPVTMPNSFVRLALRICSDQGWERDRNGRVPLSVAAMCMGSQYGCERGDWVYPIKALTETCPSSASMADRDGRLPLHLAIDAGYRSWDTGIEAILLDAPRALATRDMTTHLYPFMMAAIDTKTDLTTVFLLLRQNPTLAWGLAEDPPWVKTAKLRDRVKCLEGENAELRLEVERLRSQVASMQTTSEASGKSDMVHGENDSSDERNDMAASSQVGHVAQKRKRA